ncbi:MAG: adenylyl-sulfate kinase [Bdellovibrionales bacterium]
MTRPLRVAVAGYVDHGKSTIIGRLLSDTKQVREDKFSRVRESCLGRRFEYAFLLDALDEEQQQGITIDVTEVPWVFGDRTITFVDTPGHKEFLKNMVGGASRADAALLVVDAQEGLKAHFHKQVAVLHLLGVPRVVVALNKMDLVEFSSEVYVKRVQQLENLFEQVGMTKPVVVPVAGWSGAGLLTSAPEMLWYSGPTLAHALLAIEDVSRKADSALRFSLQDIYKFDDKRIYVGRVESGRLTVGQTLRFLPSGRESVVKTIEVHGEENRQQANTGEAIGITLEDPLFLERGEIGADPSALPRLSRQLTSDLFWLAPTPLSAGQSYKFRSGHAEMTAFVDAIESVLDPENLSEKPSDEAITGDLARVRLSLDKSLAHDFFSEVESTGRFVLVENYQVAGGGRILPDKRAYLSTEVSLVTMEARAKKFGHRGQVIWATGLSGAGKSTLMRELERRLFAEDIQVFVLDGDNVRQGICSDLGFSPTDRTENIRRVAEVAKLMADAGLVVLSAFLTPLQSQRELARQIVGSDRFVEVFVDCPIEKCEERDPKSLYKKARLGEIVEFTGIDSPFEVPESPDLHLSTHKDPIASCVDQLMVAVRQRIRL